MHKLSDYHFDLPEELIAQRPADTRDGSRLLVVNKDTGTLSDHQFPNIIDFLEPNDCLVINNTKVIPARLIGKKTSTGAKIEILLIKQIHHTAWEALVKPGKKAPVGTRVHLGECTAIIGDDVDHHGTRKVDFEYKGDLTEFIESYGKEPLPPYIKRESELSDKERYQTVFAEKKGAVAAPTAGLHFTDEILAKVKAKGVHIAPVTLHVGLGTFRPVKVDSITDHEMHAEYYEIPESSAKRINETKQSGKGRIICVGTTSVRTIESATDEHGFLIPKVDSTNIFIYPGYQFKIVDALITNFHTPESTLLMLVSAFGGYETMMNAYKHAVDEHYRFFSYGDSMLIK